MNTSTLLWVIVAYLFGSLSSAIIICQLLRLPDPRTQGSKNPGATNVLRIGGKGPAIATLLGDILKGVIPVLIAKACGLSPLSLSAVTLAAFLGHLFPLYFHFQGGKGVATAFGCALALAWPAGLSLAATWLITAMIFRYSSLASLIATLLGPVYLWFFTQSLAYTAVFALIGLLLIYRHRGNIQKLLSGNESKIGKSKLTDPNSISDKL